MKRKLTWLLSVVVGMLSLSFLLRGKKMNTKPGEADTREPSENGKPGKQAAPGVRPIRPDEQRPKTKDGASGGEGKAKPAKKRWTNKRKQTWFTGIVAAATVINVIGFVYSLREIRISREFENAPIINISDIRMNTSLDKVENFAKLEISFNVVNTGKTPAINAKPKYFTNFFNENLPKDFRVSASEGQNARTIIPAGQSFGWKATREINNPTKTYVMLKEMKLYLWGVD